MLFACFASTLAVRLLLANPTAYARPPKATIKFTKRLGESRAAAPGYGRELPRNYTQVREGGLSGGADACPQGLNSAGQHGYSPGIEASPDSGALTSTLGIAGECQQTLKGRQ